MENRDKTFNELVTELRGICNDEAVYSYRELSADGKTLFNQAYAAAFYKMLLR